jgi:hypothetical protein
MTGVKAKVGSVKIGRPRLDDSEFQAYKLHLQTKGRQPHQSRLAGELLSEYIQRLWMMDKYTPDQIRALILLAFRKTISRKVLNWHYHNILNSGIENVPRWADTRDG